MASSGTMCVFAALLLLAACGARAFVIDAFGGGPLPEVTIARGDATRFLFRVQSEASGEVSKFILGTERDVYLNATVLTVDPPATQSARLSIGSAVTLSVDTGVSASLIIQWDGVDGSPALRQTGLNCINLVGEAEDNIFSLYFAAFESPDNTVFLKVCTGIVPVCEEQEMTDIMLLNSTRFVTFDSFTTLDFTCVGAVQLSLIKQQSVDVSLTTLRSPDNACPEGTYECVPETPTTVRQCCTLPPCYNLTTCPYLAPTITPDIMNCTNGTCNVTSDGWDCCYKKNLGRRTQCPQNVPVMCTQQTCGGNGDFCCDITDTPPVYACADLGGPRNCCTPVTTTTTTTTTTSTTTTTRTTTVTTTTTTPRTCPPVTACPTTTVIPTRPPNPGCPYLNSSTTDDILECYEGRCNVRVSGWDCCRINSGRKQCPKNRPLMCAAQTCGGDYCCDSLADGCARYGGPRDCNGVTPSVPATTTRATTPVATRPPTTTRPATRPPTTRQATTTRPATRPPTRPPANTCDWRSSSGITNTMNCQNGGSCDVIREGWACCGSRGGRKQCPAVKPLMCVNRKCGNDYCCDTVADNCARYGGPRPC